MIRINPLHNNIARKPIRRNSPRFLLFLFLALCLSLPALPAYSADGMLDNQTGRIRTGLKIFRSLLLADREIENKVNTQDETDIIFIYHSNGSKAKHFARTFVRMGRLENKGQIKGSHIKVHIMRRLNSIQEANIKPAAIFLVDPLIEDRVKAIADYGIDNKIITFSPFEGDVENGILGGMVVTSRIHPFINTQTVEQSKVEIKPFFLKVAKTHATNNIK